MKNTKENTVRLWQLDFLKGIACIVVVMLHFPFDGIFGKAIIYSCRFSVPIFFLISGYFCYEKNESQIINSAKKLFFLIVKTEIFYGLFTYLCGFLQGKSATEITKTIYAFRNPIGRLFYGSFFNGYLWYLYALVWTYIFFYFLKNWNLLEKCFFTIPVLICVQVLGCYFLTVRYGLNRYIHLFRNPITFGFPITLLGYWIAKHEQMLTSRLSLKKSFGIICFGGCLMVFEFLFAHQYLDFHFSTAFISVGLFLFALNYAESPSKAARFISYVGRELSLDIYLSQLFWGTCFGFSLFGLRPIFVLLLSGLWAHFMGKIRKRRRGAICGSR